ncbi:SAYSvFN domain-containing protein 1-like [Dreissena polymorpha]|uniref:SAYSvFN domain-containing protein n=1 Tax=Dreissena polymorpha TaxID=45954 RepID=A0A9D4L323_DREPO|nr:SAYSvFN domain-containing protein 1-like [Dreissena polymorpha]KAH3850716.1 hypothetical protein DPMN_093189 [Dreissena polymorpha]
MEKQLAEYRARKEKERLRENKTVFGGWFSKKQGPVNVAVERHQVDTTEEGTTLLIKPGTNCVEPQVPVGKPESSQYSAVESIPEPADINNWKKYTSITLKVLLWGLLWKYFISIGFGAVYFIISCSFLMYINTSTGPRLGNRLSAYSVFNPNQERIDGTFTAEQFESELRHGSHAVK